MLKPLITQVHTKFNIIFNINCCTGINLGAVGAHWGEPGSMCGGFARIRVHNRKLRDVKSQSYFMLMRLPVNTDIKSCQHTSCHTRGAMVLCALCRGFVTALFHKFVHQSAYINTTKGGSGRHPRLCGITHTHTRHPRRC